MVDSRRRLYTFGAFGLDPDEKVLFHAGRPVSLTPKALDTLIALVERRGHLVTKEELFRIVWPDAFVEENNLTQNISLLRRVLGDAAGGRDFIETVPRRGYRFRADVVEQTNTTEAASSLPQLATPAVPIGSAAPPVRAPLTARFSRAAAWILGATLLTILGYSLSRTWIPRGVPPVRRFERIEVARITNSGSAISAHVSPDGRYIVHVIDEDGRRGLWLMQVATATSVRLVPARDVDYWGLTFSPDGHYVYYVAWEPNKPDAELFRIPTLGGSPESIPHSRGIGAPVTFAPDGSRIAYLADSSSTSDTQLVLARSDGSEVRLLAARKKPNSFSMYRSGAAWSPDNSVIACAAGVPGTTGVRKNIVTIRVNDGSERTLGAGTWHDVGRIAWVPDGSGVVMTASADRWSPLQVWFVSYPDGLAHRVTSDVNYYGDVSLTGDGRTLVAVQAASVAALWVITKDATKRLVTEAERYAGTEGMSWTPTGELLYRSKASGTWDIWIVDPERGEPRRVTFDPHSELHPALSSDGRVLTFTSDRTGRFHLWTVPLDRPQTPVQLTNGPDEEVYPQVSGDGRWVVYQKGFAWFQPLSIWKVPFAGGATVQLVPPTTLRPAISPDAELVAYFVLDRERWGIAVTRLTGGPSIKTFALPPTSSRALRWTPDGTALAYIDSSQGVSNIWRQPLAGGPPSRMTDFRSERIFDFAFSRDGARLAVMRGADTTDVVVITTSQGK